MLFYYCSMATLKVLRDLPGVQGIAGLCHMPHLWEHPYLRETQDKVDAVSTKLFCITALNTKFYGIDRFSHEDDLEEDEEEEEEDTDGWSEDDSFDIEEYRAELKAEEASHEEKFQAVTMPWPASKPLWDVLGWDISDGKGNELICAHLFCRQIIAVEGSLIPGAHFCPEGDGLPAFDDEGRPIDREKAWASSLAADAERFMREKGRGQ
jgi:hypothetical protein